MARTAINISEIMNSASKGNSAKTTVENVEYGIGTTRNRIDSKILNRNNIRSRINTVKNKVGQIEDDIAAICAVVNDAALKYQNAENTVIGYANVVINDSRLQNKSSGVTRKFSSYFHEIAEELTLEYAENGNPQNKNVWEHLLNLFNDTEKLNNFFTDYLPGEELVLAGKMLIDGIKFGTYKGGNGKVYLQMDNLKNLTHTEISDLLKKYVTDSNLTDYDIRSLINDGIPLYNKSGNMAQKGQKIADNVLDSTDNLLDITGALKSCKSIPDKLKYAGGVYVDTFVDEFTGIFKPSAKLQGAGDIFDFSNFSSLSKAEKVDDILVKAGKTGEVLGVVGDTLTVGVEIFENNYNPETQSWEITPQSVIGTVTDITIDFATSAGATAAGAAVGSFIVPPVGTVVGAAAGLAIDALINWEFDLDGDGEKNSAVGVIKDVADVAVDTVVDGVDAAVDFISGGIDSIAGKIGKWFR